MVSPSVKKNTNNEFYCKQEDWYNSMEKEKNTSLGQNISRNDITQLVTKILILCGRILIFPTKFEESIGPPFRKHIYNLRIKNLSTLNAVQLGHPIGTFLSFIRVW